MESADPRSRSRGATYSSCSLLRLPLSQTGWPVKSTSPEGARVTVLPVQIRAGYDIKPVMERFDLTTVQYLRILNGTEDELKDDRGRTRRAEGKDG